MADIKCLKTFDGREIFDHELNPTQKAYVTGTPLSESDHVAPQVFDDSVYLGEEPGSLYATTFHGALAGIDEYEFITPADVDAICGRTLDDSLYNVLPYGKDSLILRQNIQVTQEGSELIIS